MPLAQAMPLMEVSYDIANEDDLLGKSDDDEQIPPYQVPRKPKQPKQQRQSRDMQAPSKEYQQTKDRKVTKTSPPQPIHREP